MSEARPASAMMRSLAAAATMIATLVLPGVALLRWRDIGWEALVWLAPS